jgi:hypothetical protein
VKLNRYKPWMDAHLAAGMTQRHHAVLLRFRLLCWDIAIIRPDGRLRAARKCPNCPGVEDEFHVMFECSHYADISVKHFDAEGQLFCDVRVGRLRPTSGQSSRLSNWQSSCCMCCVCTCRGAVQMAKPLPPADTAPAAAGRTAKGRGLGFRVSPSVALACKGPLNARLATGVGLSFFPVKVAEFLLHVLRLRGRMEQEEEEEVVKEFTDSEPDE